MASPTARHAAAASAAALIAALLMACQPEADAGGGPGGNGAGNPSGPALTTVKDLPVKGRAPKTGYSREKFGEAWEDVDHNGCDTRDDILKRDLIDETFRGNDDCVITRGTLNDPYTGHKVVFVRGGRSEVDIDHAVALSDAWQKGANGWSEDKRTDFANDPLNLIAVDASTNRAKSDGDAATWLPPNKGFRCEYVARQAAVKKKYHVWVTKAEQSKMVSVLNTCPDEKLPTSGPAHDPGKADAKPGGDRKGKDDKGKDDGQGAVKYENCAAVRAAGKAPLHRGDPGYGSHLDRDGDGTACDG